MLYYGLIYMGLVIIPSAAADAGVGDPGVIAKSLELQNEALQRQLGLS